MLLVKVEEQKKICQDWEVTQLLRPLTTLIEDLGLVTSIHTVAYCHLYVTPIPENLRLSSALLRRWDIQVGKTPTHIGINIFF